jgi:NitT/TauT family transport system substrate-binding protein
MRHFLRSKVGKRIAPLLACVALAGCSTVNAETTNPGPISIHGNKTTFEIAPALLAAERYYPGEATVKMGGVPNLFGAPGVPGFSEPGIADVATNAETQALRISVANPDLRIIMTVSEGLYRIVGRRSAGIRSLADLKGKRIATISNTSSGYFLHKMLKSVGLTEADVTVVPIMPLTGIAQALAEGKVDAATIWEPEIENAARAIGSDAIEFSDKRIYRELFNLNTTGAALADPVRRKKIVAFVRAIIKASEEIRANPSVAWPLVVNASGYTREVVERSWPHHTFPAVLMPDVLDVMVEEEAWLAAKDKRPARTREQLALLIDDSVMREALQAE